jgi:hypothetical protein
MVTSGEIHKVVLEHAGDPLQASRELIRMANEAGGRDNVSAIVIEGGRFREAVHGEPARSQQSFSIPESLRPLTSRPAMFLYGLMAGVSLLVYLQISSIGGSMGFPWNSARTHRVSAVGGSFVSISEALRTARPGDRIEVEPGEYRESLVLPDGVAVMSTVPHAAIIRPLRNAAGSAIGIVGEGVRVDIAGFRILPGDDGLDVGIRLKDAAVLVSNIEMDSPLIAGIQIEGNTSGLIRGNSVTSSAQTALSIRGLNDVRLELNWFGRGPAAGPTVQIEESASAHVLKNTIESKAGTPAVSAPAQLLAEIMKNNVVLLENSRSSPESLRK